MWTNLETAAPSSLWAPLLFGLSEEDGEVSAVRSPLHLLEYFNVIYAVFLIQTATPDNDQSWSMLEVYWEWNWL